MSAPPDPPAAPAGPAPRRRALARLSGRERDPQTDRLLALILAFVAGAANAGGFMAVGAYTSHMTGILSAMADELALGRVLAATGAATALVAFIAGAAVSAILINWARRRELHAEYALPLLLEGALLGAFALLGPSLRAAQPAALPVAVLLLCFVMGLQNAMITKLSGARIRTTHVTGLVTDLGIELGKGAYRNAPGYGGPRAPVRADKAKLRLLAELAGLFFLGGVIGALAFQRLGFAAALPLALLVAALGVGPALADLRGPRR